MDSRQQQKREELKKLIEQFMNPPVRQKVSDPEKRQRLKKRRRRSRRKELLFLSAVLAVLILGILLIGKGCAGGRRDALCGKWDLDGVTTYVFDGKGAGALELPEKKYEFRYKLRKGKISIDFADEKARDVTYAVTIKKEELTLVSEENKNTATVTYRLKKQNESSSQ